MALQTRHKLLLAAHLSKLALLVDQALTLASLLPFNWVLSILNTGRISIKSKTFPLDNRAFKQIKENLRRRTQLGASSCQALSARLENVGDGLGELCVEHVGDALGQDLCVHIVVVVQHIKCFEILPAVAGRLRIIKETGLSNMALWRGTSGGKKEDGEGHNNNYKYYHLSRDFESSLPPAP